MTTWKVSHQDGPDVVETMVEGKLSLDTAWAFILAPEGIVAAFPTAKVISILSEEAFGD